MADFSLEQQRALARARARLRAKGSGSQPPAAQAPVGVGEDMGRGAASGLLRGGLDLLGSIVNPAGALTQGGMFEQTIEDIGGRTFYDAQTAPGKVAQTAAQVVPFGVAGGGGGAAAKLAKDAIRFGAVPGAASEVAGQATEGTPWEVPARVAAGVAAGVAPSVARRAVTPRTVPQQNAEAAKVLRDAGIDNLTEGQVTQNRGVQAKERKAQGLFYDPSAERVKQFEKLTSSALGKAGILGRRATPEVMEEAFTRIGRRFDDLADRNSIRIDPTFGEDVGDGIRAYMDLGPAPEKVNALRKFVERIGGVIDQQGVVAGKAYKSLRSDIERAARGSADPDYAAALRNLKDSLDDAMERSMAAAGSDDLGAWRAVRRQYRNILVVEDAVGTTSPEAAAGLITPQALRGAVKGKHGKRNMVRGRGDFEELSRAASMLLTDLPFTGAAPFNPSTIWQAGIAAPVEALMRAGRDIRMSRPVQEWLTNRRLPPPEGVSDTARSAAPAVPLITDVRRDKNGIPVLGPKGEYLPAR